MEAGQWSDCPIIINQEVILVVSNPYDKAHELARSIQESQVFQRYLAAQRVVDQNPDHKDKILRMRGKQMELNRAQILGQGLPPDIMSELSQQLAEMRQYPEMNEFLEAETHFFNLFQDIQNIIQKALDGELKG